MSPRSPPHRIAAARATAVEADAVAGAGDAEALAGAAAGGAGDGRGARAGRGAGAGQGRDIRVGIRVGVVGVVLKLNLVEPGAELIEAGGLAGGDDVPGLAWLHGLGADDAGGRNWATLGDGAGRLTGMAAGLDHGGGGWDIEDVQLAAGGGLDGVLAGGIVRDVIAIEDVVVPVALALLDQGVLEAERALEAAGLRGVLGERELTRVVVPRAEQVDGLAVGGSAEREVQLNSGHFRLSIASVDWKKIVMNLE